LEDKEDKRNGRASAYHLDGRMQRRKKAKEQVSKSTKEQSANSKRQRDYRQ
jgi:hypothetical protein